MVTTAARELSEPHEEASFAAGGSFVGKSTRLTDSRGRDIFAGVMRKKKPEGLGVTTFVYPARVFVRSSNVFADSSPFRWNVRGRRFWCLSAGRCLSNVEAT